MNNPEINGTKIPPFLAAKNLEPYVTKDVLERTKLIEYQDGTSKKTGYVATLIPNLPSQRCKLHEIMPWKHKK